MKKKLKYIILLLITSSNLFGQTEFRYFEFMNGSDSECARIRFSEVKEMIETQDFSLLKNIYPKANKQVLYELMAFSIKRKSWGYIGNNFGNSGATRNICDNCSKLTISHLMYKQFQSEIDDLYSLKLVIHKNEPFFIDTLIINDTLDLPTEIRENLRLKRISAYPPFEFIETYNCFGQKSDFNPAFGNFSIEYDEEDKPYLNGGTYGRYLKENPQLLNDIVKMNLPIKASIECKHNLIDCTKDLNDLQLVNDLSLLILEPIEFPKALLQNQNIKKLKLNISSMDIDSFSIPDEVFQMRALQEITINNRRSNIVIIKLPALFYEKNCRIAIRKEFGKIGFVQKNN